MRERRAEERRKTLGRKEEIERRREKDVVRESEEEAQTV